MVTGVAVWAIWGGDMFPQEQDPKGDPGTWSQEELRRWLAAVGYSPVAVTLLVVLMLIFWVAKPLSSRLRHQGAVAGARPSKHENIKTVAG